MRNHILLLSAAIILGACADDQHATAPASTRSGAASFSAASDVPPGPGTSAKPIDQIGWTKAVTVASTPLVVAPGASGFITATCPAGTTAVGGGFNIDVNGGPAPIVYLNNPSVTGTGWNAGVRNLNAAGGYWVTITSLARCAS